jgi:hypothetical protein
VIPSRERLLRYLRACGPSARWWLVRQGIPATVIDRALAAGLIRALPDEGYVITEAGRAALAERNGERG